MEFNQVAQLAEPPREVERSKGCLTTRRQFVTLCSAAAVGSLAGCSGMEQPSSPDLNSLPFSTLTQVARAIQSGQVSPIELTEMMLERIDSIDPRLKSYATVTAQRAREAARRAEQEILAGSYRGSLHGVPVAVKDLCYTKGTRTMGGLSFLKEFIPGFDATVVSRLEAAGAVLLGKLNLTEGAMAGYHPDFDIPVNPWNEKYWPGASSSGSGVATAAGLCYASLGSDTGGSIRFPSMANGTVGIKPTYGRVSRYGILPLAESLDHVGPMTRSVRDAAILLATIAGYDENDPTSLKDPVPDMLAKLDAGIRGLRIGYDQSFSSEGIDAGLIASIETALETLASLGATLVELEMPAQSKEVGDPWFTICAYEAHQAHREPFSSSSDEFGAYFREFLEFGASVTTEQFQAAEEWRRDFNTRFLISLEEVDALICPSGGYTFPVAPDVQYGGSETLQPLFDAVQMYFTIPADFAGTPALTVPCGFSEAGLPYALQLMGQPLSEARLCRIGHTYEQATEWHTRHPQL